MKITTRRKMMLQLCFVVIICSKTRVVAFHTACSTSRLQYPSLFRCDSPLLLQYTPNTNIDVLTSKDSDNDEISLQRKTNNDTSSSSSLDLALVSNITTEEFDDLTLYSGQENNNGNNIDESDNKQPIASIQWPLLVLTFSVAILSALDRVAMSVAILPLSSEYHLTESAKGLVSSVFSAGYGLAIIPAGLLVASNSPKVAIGCGVFLWSVGTILTPISLLYGSGSGEAGLGLMLGVRSIVGAAESIVLPAVQKIMYVYVPRERKSLATAGLYSGFQLGTILAYLLSPLVIDACGGWKGMFYVYGVLGLVWLVPWITLVDTEGEDGNYPKEGIPILKPVEQVTAVVASSTSPPWNIVLTSPSVWAITMAHAANNWGLYNSLSWAPTFYAEQYNLNVKDSAFLSLLPSVAGALSGLLAGFLADTLIQKIAPNDNTNIRKLFQGVALLGPAVCYAVLSQHIPDNPTEAQILLTTATALQAFNAGGYGPACQEKAGIKWGAFLYSITSLPGVMLGTLGVYVTGRILDANGKDWGDVFALNAGIFLIGAIGFILFYNGRRELD